MIKKVWAKMLLFFKRQIIRKLPMTAKKKLRKPYTKGRKRTISDTLDKLDFYYDRLMRKDDKQYQGTHWKTRRGLKKAGVYIPPPHYRADDTRINHEKRPAIIFVGPGDRWMHAETKDDMSFPTFYYAEKRDKSPPFVQKGSGVVYEVGIAYGRPKNKAKGGTLWVIFFVSIEGDQAVPLKYLYEKENILPRSRKRGVHRPATSYSTSAWTYGNVGTYGTNDPYQWVKEITHEMFNFWQAKREMWAIIVKKGSRRMNFCVEARETKYYFKDRVRVETPSGRMKPIIHYVAGFTRKNGSKVIPHIRGLRQFRWNGYDINVKNPELSDQDLIFDAFDLAGTEDELSEVNTLNLPQTVTYMQYIDDAPQENIADIINRKAIEKGP